MTLKKLNRKSENDFIDVKDIKPDFKFEVTSEIKPLLNHFKKLVVDFVTLNNDYVKVKINEEKVKAKKPKIADDKLEA